MPGPELSRVSTRTLTRTVCPRGFSLSLISVPCRPRPSAGTLISLLSCFTLFLFPNIGAGAVIDFESIPPGTVFGGVAGNLPGDVVYTQDGIAMSVQQFFLGSYTGFVRAQVGGKYDPFVPTTPLGLENISVLFDFTAMGFDVTTMTLEYYQFGGANNFAVNGGTIYQVNAFSALPLNIAPGVFAFVTNSTVVLTGDIKSVRVGGQELAIDNVTAIPEPGCLLLLLAGVGAFALRKYRR